MSYELDRLHSEALRSREIIAELKTSIIALESQVAERDQQLQSLNEQQAQERKDAHQTDRQYRTELQRRDTEIHELREQVQRLQKRTPRPQKVTKKAPTFGAVYAKLDEANGEIQRLSKANARLATDVERERQRAKDNAQTIQDQKDQEINALRRELDRVESDVRELHEMRSVKKYQHLQKQYDHAIGELNARNIR